MRLPVLNYHSVSADPSWRLPLPPWLSIHPVSFEAQLDWLNAHHYETVFMSEAHALLSGERPWPPRRKVVALTFDDGYADNWTAAFPRLQARGMKATFFVSTDFIDWTSSDCRPPHDAEPGYLNAAELQAMADSGLAEIQSHGARHERVFIGDEPCGVETPEAPNLQLYWSAYPERKIHWWRNFPDAALEGRPIFPQGTGLNHPVYTPPEDAVQSFRERMSRRIRRHGLRSISHSAVRAVWEDVVGRGGTFETDQAFEWRRQQELTDSRERLESLANRPVEVFCWPENEVTPAAHRQALSTGYRATVSNYFDRPNVRGQAPDCIARHWAGDAVFGFRNRFLDAFGFSSTVRSACGHRRPRPALKLAGGLRRARIALRRCA